LRADYDVPRPNPELEAGLNQAIEQDQLGNWLAGLAPQDEEYRLLASAYAEASLQSGADRRGPIADGATLRPGRADPRLPAIVAALRAGGYLPAPQGQQAPPAARYGPDMVAAVRSLQEDYGLERAAWSMPTPWSRSTRPRSIACEHWPPISSGGAG
jgi:murein L,D-transpeptidase YcbB/YkuD